MKIWNRIFLWKKEIKPTEEERAQAEGNAKNQRIRIARSCIGISGPWSMYYLSRFAVSKKDSVEINRIQSLILSQNIEELSKNQSIDMMKDVIEVYAIVHNDTRVDLVAIVDPFDPYSDPYLFTCSPNASIGGYALSNAYSKWEIDK